MNQDVKTKWVEALRSGKYRQAQGGLYVTPAKEFTPEMCCLGVLCEVMGQETGRVTWRNAIDSRWQEVVVDDWGTDIVGSLPMAVQVWSGLESPSGELPQEAWVPDEGGWCADCGEGHVPRHLTTLADLNDKGQGFDFAKIADIIEEYL
jgi:hypothetical protein